MVRLARPVPKGQKRAHSVSARAPPWSRWPFAAITLPKENPLRAMAAAVELPWLSAFREEQDSAEGPPSKRRLETVSEFFQYTEHQGVMIALMVA